MTKLTKEQMAAHLNGCKIGDEVTRHDETIARESGLVIVFGASDDLIEFRGAIYDELGCFAALSGPPRRHGYIITKDGKAYREPVTGVVGASLTAWWAAEPGYSWTYETGIPHATFEIVEDGEPYCRGIVFALEDL